MYKKVAKKLLLFLFTILVLVGCERETDIKLSVHTIPLPGDFDAVTWIDDWLILEETERPWLERLWRIRSDGSELEMLPMPDSYDGCLRTGFIVPTHLPDNRLGYIRVCQGRGATQTTAYMMAYDLETGEVSQLVDRPLPTFNSPRGDWSWNPTMTEGITSDGVGAGLGSRVYLFWPTGWEYLNIDSPAFAVDWSPNGNQIAFMATKTSGSSPSILLSEYNLYLMDPYSHEKEVLVDGFFQPRGLRWSPDSQWLAVEAHYQDGFNKREGLWLVNVSTGEVRLILEGAFLFPAWSPNGEQIATIDIPQENKNDQLMIIDILPLLQNK